MKRMLHKPRALLCPRALLLSLAVLLSLSGLVLSQPLNKSAVEELMQAVERGYNPSLAEARLLRDLNAVPERPGPATRELGPDSFGYIATDNNDPGGPVFQWIDISGIGTEVAAGFGLGDEDTVGPFPIGFEFPWYGQPRTQFWVQSNGVISFFPTNVGWINRAMPSDYYGSMIAWFWDDLDPDNGVDGGQIYYKTMNVSGYQALVISFVEIDEYPDGPNQDTITAQMILFPNGSVVIQYQNIDPGFDIAGGTAGIQGDIGTSGLTYVHNGNPAGHPYSGLSVLYRRLPPDAAVQGVVLNGTNGTPLAGATVTLGDLQTTTNMNGIFSFSGLYTGTDVTLTAWRGGFYPQSWTGTLLPGQNQVSLSLTPLPAGETEPGLLGFEQGIGFFSVVPGNVNWERGEPSAQPDSAHGGNYCIGTAIDTFYTGEADDWAASTEPFQVLDASAVLRYWHWYNIEAGFDGYNVQVSTNGGVTWEVLMPLDGYSDPDGVPANGWQSCFNNAGGQYGVWRQVTCSLAPYAGRPIWFAFRFVSDMIIEGPGVCIDDVEVFPGGVGPHFSVDLVPHQQGIPPGGGNVTFDAIVHNLHDIPLTAVLWTQLMLPNGNNYGTLQSTLRQLEPGELVFLNRSLHVPAGAAPGTYTLIGRVSTVLDTILAIDGFHFQKNDPSRRLAPVETGR